MKLTLKVLPPDGTLTPSSFIPRLRSVLTNIEVAFTIEEASSNTPIIEVMDTSDTEAEFIVRMLQRSGYDVEICL